MDKKTLEKLAQLFRLRQRHAYRVGRNGEGLGWARAREDLHIVMHDQTEEGFKYGGTEFLDTMIAKLAEVLDGVEVAHAESHECVSVITSDGHGAYCSICGETIA